MSGFFLCSDALKSSSNIIWAFMAYFIIVSLSSSSASRNLSSESLYPRHDRYTFIMLTGPWLPYSHITAHILSEPSGYTLMFLLIAFSMKYLYHLFTLVSAVGSVDPHRHGISGNSQIYGHYRNFLGYVFQSYRASAPVYKQYLYVSTRFLTRVYSY